MITAQELSLVEQVLEDIRLDFPIKESVYTFSDRMNNLVAERVWKVIADIRKNYREEFDEYNKDMEVKCGRT